MRAFLGIALTGPVVSTLGQASNALREASPAWRDEKWVPAENLHITVRFLGDVPDDGMRGLQTLMAEVTSQHPAHDITLVGITAQPRARSANMLWATFGGRIGTTATLADALAEALASDACGRPEHPFAPHATLVRARLSKPIAMDALDVVRQAIEAASAPERTMSVAAVTLFSSTLTPRGPRYGVLGVAELKQD